MDVNIEDQCKKRLDDGKSEFLEEPIMFDHK